MSSHVVRLMREHNDLLVDERGEFRGLFVPAPKTVVQSMADAWGLGGSRLLDNCVESKLHRVQGRGHLLHYPVSPGPGFFVNDCTFKNLTSDILLDANSDMECALGRALDMIEHKKESQSVSFNLSFVKTKEGNNEAQDPHVDFRWSSLSQEGCGARGDRSLAWKEKVPFSCFFPLTRSGMKLEIWKHRSDHRQGRDEKGVLIDIPFGVMLLMRGDTVHAGGFANGSHGDPRGHAYVYKSGGEAHNTLLTNEEYLPGRSGRLSDVYLHGDDVPALVLERRFKGGEICSPWHSYNNDVES